MLFSSGWDISNSNGDKAVTLSTIQDQIIDSDCRTIVHPTAGGRIRGAHNCKKCDAEVVAAIERYSVSRDLREFKGLDCECKKVWKTEIENDLSLPVPMGQGRDRRLSRVDIVRAP